MFHVKKCNVTLPCHLVANADNTIFLGNGRQDDL